MKPIVAVLSTGFAVALTTFALAAFADRAFAESDRTASEPNRIERGRYIAHRVGMCTSCHSPRDSKGQFIEGKHLTGAALPHVATPGKPQMPVAPNLAGLPAGFTAEDTVHFLMTGERPNGRPAPLPPMPPYRLDRDDAEAVTAYLRSLASSAP